MHILSELSETEDRCQQENVKRSIGLPIFVFEECLVSAAFVQYWEDMSSRSAYVVETLLFHSCISPERCSAVQP